VTPQTPKEQRNASLKIKHLYETILGRLKEAKAL
jgi:NitT/TauT family transport system ATP-binding protein/sulfonate transport system ATP-binding protein